MIITDRMLREGNMTLKRGRFKVQICRCSAEDLIYRPMSSPCNYKTNDKDTLEDFCYYISPDLAHIFQTIVLFRMAISLFSLSSLIFLTDKMS